jgi:hypothetical protein
MRQSPERRAKGFIPSLADLQSIVNGLLRSIATRISGRQRKQRRHGRVTTTCR